MARPFHGHEQVAVALSCIQNTKSAAQLRRAQAVVLPLLYGLNLDQTAEATGLSKSWASKVRNAFVGVEDEKLPKQGGRHRQCFTREAEAQLLQPFLAEAAKGEILVFSQIKPALEKALGRPMALTTAYNILHRNGWRKLAPDKSHPKSDPQAQEAFKKTSKIDR